jgi:hypothetical protein
MKNMKYIFLLILGLGVLFACKKPDSEPVLDMSQTVVPGISSPDDGGTYVLTSEDAANDFASFQWSAAVYNLPDLETVKYALQYDLADSNFKNVASLITTEELMFTPTVSAMNDKALAMGAVVGEATDFSFRIKSFINDETGYSDAFSQVITLTITPYEDVVTSKVIYLLGSGTTIGWDNTKAWPLTPLGDGKYAITEHLVPGADQFIKFISILGQWAPQWGTDATGTAEEGPLVYRPDETVADPAAIPVGETEGNYYIEADTVNLTYTTILTSGALYLVGGGTPAGWDNTLALPFTQDPDTLTKFTIVTSLNAEGGMKFLEVLGQWAPQWGSYDGGPEGGTLSYRPTESVPDPPEIPVPGTAGEYMITVDLRAMKYWFTAQ